ncbi:MAG: hypothetical protein MJ016_04060 [Victivallaceae bacterium]|nr:hypothetical protein [Victivallaceae bacterium]
MNRGKWIRLVFFFIVFALIMLFPLYKFWLFEYTPGTEIALPISHFSASPGRLLLSFQGCNLPADKTMPRLSGAYACFSVEDGIAKITGIAESRGKIPAGVPYVKVRNLFVQPTWKNGEPGAPYFYHVELPFRTYETTDKNEVKMLQERLPDAKLVVVLYDGGDYRVKGLRFD